MLQFVYGFIGALAFLCLFALAVLCGWKLRGAFDRQRKPDLPEPGAEERKRLVEEQEAFHLIQNYSAERAYGLAENRRTDDVEMG